MFIFLYFIFVFFFICFIVFCFLFVLSALLFQLQLSYLLFGELNNFQYSISSPILTFCHASLCYCLVDLDIIKHMFNLLQSIFKNISYQKKHPKIVLLTYIFCHFLCSSFFHLVLCSIMF